MKTYIYSTFTVLMSLCLAFSACQDIDDYEYNNNYPEIGTTNVLSIKSTSATLRYSKSEPSRYSWDSKYNNLYFLCSTSPEFTDTIKAYAEIVEVKSSSWNSSSKYYKQGELTGLTPGTTYYVKTVIPYYVEGTLITELESEVTEFTTSSNLKVTSITYTDWNGQEYNACNETDTLSPVGLYLFGSKYYYNYFTSIDESYTTPVWKMPIEIPAEVISQAYAYWPYSGEEGREYVRVSTYKYNAYEPYSGNYNIMYAEGKVNDDGSAVSFNLKHMMARVIFRFSLAEESSEDYVRIGGMSISNGNNVLPTMGDIYPGEGAMIHPDGDAYTHPLSVSWYSYLERGRTSEATIYSIPTTAKGNVVLTVDTEFANASGKQQVELPLSEYNWEMGKTYEYDVTIEKNRLVLGDVVVNGWENSEGGDINIYD